MLWWVKQNYPLHRAAISSLAVGKQTSQLFFDLSPRKGPVALATKSEDIKTCFVYLNIHQTLWGTKIPEGELFHRR